MRVFLLSSALAATAAIFSVTVEYLPGLYGIIALEVLNVLVLILDVFIVGGMLRGEDNGRLKKWHPFTSFGVSLRQGLEVVSYRLDSQRWEIDQMSQEVTIRAEAVLSAAGKEEKGPESPEVNILKDLSTKFRATNAAMVFSRGKAGPEVVRNNSHGIKFDRALCEYSRMVLSGSEEGALIDTASEHGAGSAFANFGYRWFLACPFRCGHLTGFVWLGYPVGRAPVLSEIRRARLSAIEAGQRLSAFFAMDELLTDAKTAQSAAQEKTELLAQMSHDMRSPLSNIKSILNLLKLEGFNNDSPEMIDIALKNCESAAEIVEDLLDYSRLKLGKLSSQKKIFSFSEMATDVVESYRAAAKMKGLQFSFSADHGKFAVQIDRGQIKRVLSNLISNALKYTRKGGVHIELRQLQGKL